MILNAGERYILTGTETFARILSGEAEVYAVSREDTSFRQMYLITLGVGETAYPAGDELGFTDILIYALTDIQVDIKPFKSQEVTAHIPEMRRWFNSLVQIKWLMLFANRGDDVLATFHSRKESASHWRTPRWASGVTMPAKRAKSTLSVAR